MRWLLLAIVLLAAGPASAEAWSWGCQFTAISATLGGWAGVRPDQFEIGPQNVACYRFNAFDVGAETSPIFVVSSQTAVVCFDPDNSDAVIDTARAKLWRCTTGTAGGTGSTNTCFDTGGANGRPSLSGQGGAAAIQNACKRIGPGHYFIQVSTVCEKLANSGNYCEVSIKGENPQ